MKRANSNINAVIDNGIHKVWDIFLLLSHIKEAAKAICSGLKKAFE